MSRYSEGENSMVTGDAGGDYDRYCARSGEDREEQLLALLEPVTSYLTDWLEIVGRETDLAAKYPDEYRKAHEAVRDAAREIG